MKNFWLFLLFSGLVSTSFAKDQKDAALVEEAHLKTAQSGTPVSGPTKALTEVKSEIKTKVSAPTTSTGDELNADVEDSESDVEVTETPLNTKATKPFKKELSFEKKSAQLAKQLSNAIRSGNDPLAEKIMKQLSDLNEKNRQKIFG